MRDATYLTLFKSIRRILIKSPKKSTDELIKTLKKKALPLTDKHLVSIVQTICELDISLDKDMINPKGDIVGQTTFIKRVVGHARLDHINRKALFYFEGLLAGNSISDINKHLATLILNEERIREKAKHDYHSLKQKALMDEKKVMKALKKALQK